MTARLWNRFPRLTVAGFEPSRFRCASAEELDKIAHSIQSSGARLVLLGLGCPRQEAFAHALRARSDLLFLAVGAAFDYAAGTLRTPPSGVQQAGLEWLWRLALEPRRLWRRYVVLNPAYVRLLIVQKITGAPGSTLSTASGDHPAPA
jgi:N-acetylglucosaminyldiphosphoundecaprenol N-acetyl-beta-D-mannosaminyltransferase